MVSSVPFSSAAVVVEATVVVLAVVLVDTLKMPLHCLGEHKPLISERAAVALKMVTQQE